LLLIAVAVTEHMYRFNSPLNYQDPKFGVIGVGDVTVLIVHTIDDPRSFWTLVIIGWSTWTVWTSKSFLGVIVIDY
jgi:hypothetical protein